MIACLLLWGTTTSQARSVAKRETTNGRLDLDAFTADPDIVTLSSESVNGTTSPQPEEFTKLQTNNEGTTAKQMQVNEETSESPSVTTQLELQLEHKSSTESVQEKVKPNISTEAVAATATTQLPKLMPSTTDVPATSSSSTRAEDSARAMHFATSTERGYAFVPITPMKLRPLPMTSTTSTETPATSEVAPQLLAALLHAAVTVTPSTTAASQENIIELGQLQPLDEKRTKYISDNATNEQQLSLPNVAEVWSLAAMKMVPTTTTSSTTTTTTSSTEAGNDIEPQLQQNQTQQHKEKNLLDWQQIMLMQTGHENQTELALSTTLDATEAATQATTLQLAPSTTTTTAATTTTTAAAIESVTAASTTELTVTVQPLLTARTAAANVTAAPEPLLTEQTASVTAATAVKLQLTEQAQETTEPTITATATAVSETELATTTTTKPMLLVAFLYLMRKRQKQMSYGQRCRPVSLDAYSLDNVSVLGSVRRKGRDLRASKRTYGNAAFDDPALRHNLLTASELCKFIGQRSSIFEEFRDVPQIIARADEVPAGCEDKNRYANVIPLPETRVVLQRQGDDDKTEYINANYVRGPKDAPNYYIACQAPLESTVGDFWRMIWEQQSRVIIQATDLNENGIERCAEYLPPSVTLDNHSSYGDYQVTLKHREVKDKYAISTLMLKRADGDECRELTHYWYKWPEAGVPLEEAPIIAMLLEARSSLKSYALEQANELKEKSSTLTLKSLEAPANGQTTKPAEEVSTSSAASNEINGNVANKSARSQQGPLTIHCSPGTGRTGTIIACDMAIRNLETPKRSVDIPQLVYFVRRGRASAVQTKEQYEFIYKVANMYATKITNLSNDN
ncbi:CG42327 [Drosophila busckii]|uniref:CG42327 n=1 Tax=Drosophila busckii TaxID=30019 RepID=A0A0M3QXD8_DROBS|nr:CG42327 [Drosophila busckii]